MEKAIIRKEWIKMSKIFLFCLILSLGMAIYAVLRMNRLITLKGVDHLWLIMLLKDNSFVDLIKWTPLFCGVALSLSQMVPEMVQKRLKLTLHLPYPQTKMILLMLVCGVVALLLIYILQVLIIMIYDITILPMPLVMTVLYTMIPWYAAGITAYIFTSAICIEGKRSRRLLLAILGIAFVMIYFEQPALEAYNTMAAYILLFLVCLILLPLGSVIRFKEGLQD